MASTASVIVLTPNGIRVTVKVNPNTSILQVLEEASLKRGLNPADYELKHYNRIVEVANSFRFSGLPNNATLEMVPNSKPRQETTINLGLQLESGKRLMNHFRPQSTLWEIIKHWEASGDLTLPDVTSDTSTQPVCVYMRHEVVGQSQLESQTLRSLGLTQGSACIRLLFRTLDQLRHQANVSAPLTRPSTVVVEDEDDHEPASNQVTTTVPVPPTGFVQVQPFTNENDQNGNNGGKKRQLSVSPNPTSMDTEDDTGTTGPIDLSQFPAVVREPVVAREVKPRVSQPGDFHLLGDHHALIYHQDDVSQRSESVLDDSFFDVTRSDLESIWKDLKAKRQELEDVPLSITSFREKQREEAILRNLIEHPTTIVRIRFQNRYVLQGLFRGIDTVSAVMHMVRTYLARNDTPFYLFTSPPKSVLDPDQRLVEAGLVGSAVVYFGSEVQAENFLSSDTLAKVSCPDTIDSYIQTLGRDERPAVDPVSLNTPGQSSLSALPPPNSTRPSPTATSSQPRSTNERVVPKWFKTSK